MQRPVQIVFNPSSGDRQGESYAKRLGLALRERGRAVKEQGTLQHADVYATIDSASIDALVVVGGDGSMNAAVNALRGARLPLGFAGIGTVNVLSREADLAVEPEQVAAHVVAGRTMEIPLLAANGRCWILFTEAGFLGTIVQRVNRRRERTRKHGKLEFVGCALRVLPLAWGRPLTARFLTASGERRERRYSNVLATRARCYAGNMPLPMDGVELRTTGFQLVGFRTRTPFGHLLLLGLAGLRLLPILRRPLERLGFLDCVPCTELDVQGPPSAGVHLDAESKFGGRELHLPLRVEPAGASFRLVVP